MEVSKELVFDGSDELFDKISELLIEVDLMLFEVEGMSLHGKEPGFEISDMWISFFCEFEMYGKGEIFVDSVLFEGKFVLDVVLRLFDEV